MKCKCRDCGNEYDNGREFETSICDECFKRFNQDLLQPLKDKLRAIQGKTLLNKEEFKDGLVALGYHKRWIKEIMELIGKHE